MTGFYDIFGIWSNETAAVFAFDYRIYYDLSRLEVVQIYNGYSRICLIVDKEIVSDVFSVLLGQSGMVSIAPGYLFAAHHSAG